MPKKDYAKRQTSFGKSKESARSVWLVVIGIFIVLMSLIYLVKHHHYENAHHKIANVKTINHENANLLHVKKTDSSENHFAFYEMLPKGKIMLPDRFALEIAVSKDSELIQRKQAKLATLGIEADIDEAKKSNKIIYKLMVGPYDNKQDALAAQIRLKNSGVHSFLRKI